MADNKLDTVLSKIAQLMRIALDEGAADGERINAIRAVLPLLKKVGSDSHELVALLEKPSLDESEMKMIYEAGYNQRVAEEAAAPKPFFSAPSPFGNFQIDSDDIGDGVNGHKWADIIVFCRAHVDRIPPGKSHGFVESIFRQLTGGYDVPTPRQAPWLRDIFVRYFGGKIV